MGEVTLLPLTKSDAVTPLTPTPPPSLPPPPPPPAPTKVSTNTVIATFIYIFSLPLLCYGIWLLLTEDYSCQDSLNMPQFRQIIGIGLIVAFAISCFVTHYEAKVVLPGALALAVALLVMLTFGILLIGTYAMESRGVPASPLWIKSRIEDSETWANVKACVFKSGTCQDLAYNTIQLSAEDFNNKKLSAIEYGCCRPPSVCGMQYVNATYWRRTKEQSVSNNATNPGSSGTPATNSPPSSSPPTNSAINPYAYGDCQAFSNEVTQLCYNCRSCKQGFISTVHHKWWAHGFFMIFMSALLLLVHTLRFILTMVQRNKS